jgi:Flp pilus assembly protein TadG
VTGHRTCPRERRRPGHHRTHRLNADAGFSAVEVVLLAPLFVLMLLLVVVLGRVQQAGADVTGAARDGARAASLSRSAAQARAAAAQAVTAALTGVRCAGGPSTTVDTGRFAPGGHVQVSVSCAVPLAEVGFGALPGSTTMTRRSTSPIETYRAP